MKLQILGTGCAKCNALAQATEQAAQALGQTYELNAITPTSSSPNSLMCGKIPTRASITASARFPHKSSTTPKATNCSGTRDFMAGKTCSTNGRIWVWLFAAHPPL
jgi:hypothetical protein